ncbi:essential recombination function protein [[Clostridium] sordellii]|uniref:ERF family protein n=1 Tax=Paraclostridium sordellii TaxID=1505 RepID=UPI0005DB66F1|nr:ERF family protein [Paeniclostridium sordellii]CEQ10663.1 essential recombination function protein [[Clostridium] sordellii] [Paeniclostridium sordellii]
MSSMNLHLKIVEIKKSIEGFSKDKKSFGYEYVSGSQILRAIKDKMDELGVLLIPEVDYDTLHWEKHEYKNKKNEDKLDFLVTMKMNYTWVNAENPEDKITIPWVCIGQQADDISKAVGTAMTYNERYFLLKFLGLPTDEDDADEKELQGASKSYSKSENKINEKQISRLYAIAYKKGISKETVKDQVKKQLKKDVTELNKSEYDIVCNGYENMK